LRDIVALLLYRFNEKDQTVSQDHIRISQFDVLDTGVEIEMDNE
jgi:hypothetical protein